MLLKIIAIVFGVFVFGFSHSYFASLKFKKKLAERIGGKIAFYRLFYNIFSTVEFFAILILIPKIPIKVYDLNYPYDIITFAIQFLSFLALVWTGLSFDWQEFIGLKQIVRYFNGTYKIEDLDEKPQFRISGPFKIIRHPSYFFSIIFLGARPTMDITYLTLFISASVYFIVGAMIEEKKLVGIFGETYINYKREVPFFFPKFGSIKN